MLRVTYFQNIRENNFWRKSIFQGKKNFFHVLDAKNREKFRENMILMTMIARVADALPLAASIQEDEQVRKRFEIFKWNRISEHFWHFFDERLLEENKC